MKKYQVADVFRPNTMPLYTYINRQEKRGTTYETKLKRALQKVGSLIAISGGSKTGKTVLYGSMQNLVGFWISHIRRTA